MRISDWSSDVCSSDLPADPAQRWLAEYKLETQRSTAVDAQLRPFGSFGQNEAGMQDMVGNVWDWTDTCHSRYNLDISDVSSNSKGGQNCGLRVVAGPHRSVITDFIRDPKGGARSVGIPDRKRGAMGKGGAGRVELGGRR